MGVIQNGKVIYSRIYLTMSLDLRDVKLKGNKSMFYVSDSVVVDVYTAAEDVERSRFVCNERSLQEFS